MYGGEKSCLQVFGGETWRRELHGKPRRRWKYNIKTDFQEVRSRVMEWIDLAQDRDSWRAVVNALMNLRFPQNAENFLTNWRPLSLSGRSPLRGVTQLTGYCCCFHCCYFITAWQLLLFYLPLKTTLLLAVTPYKISHFPGGANRFLSSTTPTMES